MKLADKIKVELLKCSRGSPADIVLPNYFMGKYEADVICIKTSGYAYEYEIKISRSDFKNDLKKGFVGYFSGRENKHDLLCRGELKINKFFFVVPDKLIDVSECPNYAGLLYYNPNAGFWKDAFVCVKGAKWLHKNKFSDWENFARRLAHRHSIAKSKLFNLRNTDLVEENRKLNREIESLHKTLRMENIEYLKLQSEIISMKNNN